MRCFARFDPHTGKKNVIPRGQGSCDVTVGDKLVARIYDV